MSGVHKSSTNGAKVSVSFNRKRCVDEPLIYCVHPSFMRLSYCTARLEFAIASLILLSSNLYLGGEYSRRRKLCLQPVAPKIHPFEDNRR